MACIVTETTMRIGGDSSRGLADRSGKRTFRVQYDATTPPANLVAVETATGSGSVPALRSALPGDSSRIAKKIAVKPTGDGLLFDVEVGYERITVSGGGDEVENPLLRKDVVSFDGSSETTPFFLSEDNPKKPVTNSAGEPFEEFQERGAGIFKLVVEGNRASINPGLYASYLYPATATNDASVTVRGLIIGIGQGRIVSISATPQNENGVDFLRVRWEVAVAETWDLKLDDRGFHELNKSVVNGGLSVITKHEPAGETVDKPWPLNGSGRKKPNANDEPAELTFQRYPKKNFGAFNWTAA